MLAALLTRIFRYGALSLLVPAVVGLLYREWAALAYAGTAAVALVALAATGSKVEPMGRSLSRRDGFVAVVASWLGLIVLGAIPFWVSRDIPGLADAVFESASGYSTTGATILTDIEALPRAHLFQRSFAHWVGGMGIIVLTVAILPELAVGGMQLFTAESTGISTDKLSPRIVSTARRLWEIYVGMTVVLVLLLLWGGMDLFDSLTHAFGTVATGGFSTRNASVAAFGSTYVEWVIVVFMLLSGMSFASHYRLVVRGQTAPLFRSAEVGLYLFLFVSFSVAVATTLLLSGTYDDLATAARDAAFQVASILTTTGYGTADFDRWPDLCRFLLVVLMFIGGCAGSTAGGVKVVRLLLVFKNARVELHRLLHVNLVRPVRIGEQAVEASTMRGILGFFLLYIITTVVAATLVLATGVDLVTGVTAVVSAMNSIGPGLELVGPSANYGHLPALAKWVLSACMVIGRLEIYTVLVLFTAGFWRKRSGGATRRPF